MEELNVNEQFKFNGCSVAVTNYRECEALLKMLSREKNKLEVDKYGREALEKTISDAVSVLK